MKEMIQARKEQMQKRGKKGFTLMEMLIVVAIIAILIAIAIPTFLTQLDKARAETDVANIRSGYASAVATVMTNNTAATTEYVLRSDGSVKAVTAASTDSADYTCQGAAANADNSKQIGGVTTASGIGWSSGDRIYYKYTVGTDGSSSWSIDDEFMALS